MYTLKQVGIETYTVNGNKEEKQLAEENTVRTEEKENNYTQM